MTSVAALQLVVARDRANASPQAREVAPSFDDASGSYVLEPGERPARLGAGQMLALCRELDNLGFTPTRLELRDANFRKLEDETNEWLQGQVVSGVRNPQVDLATVQALVPRMFVAWVEFQSPSKDTVRVFRNGRVEVKVNTQVAFLERLGQAWPRVANG